MAFKLAAGIRDSVVNNWSPFFLRAAALCLLVFLAFGPAVPPASSAAVGCRGDPIIILKNGQSLKIIVKIGADATQVDSVEYTVHVPAKAKIAQIIYTGKKLRDKEQITIQYDAAPKTYGVDAIVHSQVDATVKLTAKFRNKSQSVSGWNEQLLTVTLQP
jgi:hypothetical protein